MGHLILCHQNCKTTLSVSLRKSSVTGDCCLCVYTVFRRGVQLYIVHWCMYWCFWGSALNSVHGIHLRHRVCSSWSAMTVRYASRQFSACACLKLSTKSSTYCVFLRCRLHCFTMSESILKKNISCVTVWISSILVFSSTILVQPVLELQKNANGGC